jgi:hypothetical protein
MQVVKAPEAVGYEHAYPRIFLAGSIDQGKAVDWQTRVQNALTSYSGTILNPRRDDWDSSWVQDISNPQFNQQVSWEMQWLDHADLIIMYFDPEQKSPITLLELGLHATDHRNNLVVCCPDGFWRKGNVQMVCDKYDLTLLNTLEELIGYTRLWVADQ